MKYENRFSIGHYDRFQNGYESAYYHMIKNADPAFRKSIHDIYFGKYFEYVYNGQTKRCGNAMGVQANDLQIDYLFKIQQEFGIEISLTFNTVEVPHEVVFDRNIRMQFVEWIGSFYDRGLRSCTISSTHIMRTGELQARCPDMRWKSTVNQIAADAQQFIDFAYLGYNTILLDRSLNRNIKELKRIKRAQDYLNAKNPKKKVLTSLLVAEACIYSCPFKKEHDSVGEVISTDYFRGPADITCNGWRGSSVFVELPRSGIDIVASDAETMQEFMDLVDIFKFSGRLTYPTFEKEHIEQQKAVWFFDNTTKFNQAITFGNKTIYADNYDDIMENNLSPIHDWIPGWINMEVAKKEFGDYKETYKAYTGIWSTPKGKRLEVILKTCRNQCWDCHECERTFGTEDIDSALQLRKINNEQ